MRHPDDASSGPPGGPPGGQPADQPLGQPGDQAADPQAFFAVPTGLLDADHLKMDLYLLHAGTKPVLYRSVGSSYSLADCVKLADQGVTHLHVPTEQHRVFQRLMTERLVRGWEDPDLDPSERVRVVRDSCAKMIDDLMHHPRVPGIAATLGEMATHFTRWCVEDLDRFAYLMDLSGATIETATHMVNVGVGCGMLGHELLGPESPLLPELVQGGLLHDIGKRAVSPAVLLREGKLSDDDWAQIRLHPAMGVETLAMQKGVSQTAVDMIRDHHERLDARGYPAGAAAGAIGLPARVCAVVDIFDSLATARPGRPAFPPARVLASLREEAGTMLDRRVFEAWESVVLRVVRADPSRCVPDNAGVETPKLRALLPTAPKQAVGQQPEQGRREARTPVLDRACDIGVRVRVLSGREGTAEASAPTVAARVVMIGPDGLRVLVESGLGPGTMLRLMIDGRPCDTVIRRRSFGPGGETVLDCGFVRPGRRAG